MTSPTSSPAVGKLTLAISFSGPGGSLALVEPLAVRDEIHWAERATASELATVRLVELLDRNQFSLPDLTHLLVNRGPGSFTGIRVGLNLARALSYALPRPLAAIDALTILAHKYLATGERRTIALKAVRNHYYAATFARTPEGLVMMSPPTSRSRDELSPDAALIEGESPDFDPHPRAGDLGRAYLAQPKLANFLAESVEPLYVRGSEAEEKLRK